MLVHTIGRFGSPVAAEAFTHKYIFPGGYIPALSQMMEASEKVRLIATDVEMLRVHYAKTLREWYARCMEHREAIVDDVRRALLPHVDLLSRRAPSSTFEWGGLCNFQVQYCRNRYALPLTRDYMEEAERKLLAS